MIALLLYAMTAHTAGFEELLIYGAGLLADTGLRAM